MVHDTEYSQQMDGDYVQQNKTPGTATPLTLVMVFKNMIAYI